MAESLLRALGSNYMAWLAAQKIFSMASDRAAALEAQQGLIWLRLDQDCRPGRAKVTC
jgi:hypothetical protein